MDSGDVLAGRYRLERILGRGGMGEVWQAHDESLLRRQVAVKVLSASADPQAVRRIQAEAHVLARLQHPGITVVHDAGIHDARPFIVMELLHGSDLAHVITHQPDGMPVHRVTGLVQQVADALHAAHGSGVIHRDVKPANLFLQADGDRMKICDFGIARTPATPQMTTSGHVIGTPAYMAPEQCLAKPVDGRSDMYALGCVMFALLTGGPPFAPDQPVYRLMQQHVEEPAPRIGSLRPDLPPELEDLTALLLAKDPRQRPDAKSVAETLANLTPGQRRPPVYRPPTSTPKYSLIRTIEAPEVRAVGFSPDGQTLLGAGAELSFWNAHSGELQHRTAVKGHVDSVAFAPDGSALATSGAQSHISLRDPQTGEARRDLAGHSASSEPIKGVAFSARWNVLASWGGSGVRLWKPRSGVFLGTPSWYKSRFSPWPFQPDVTAAAFSPSGDILAVATDHPLRDTPTLRLGQVESDSLVADLKLRRLGVICGLAFSPDGRYLAAAESEAVRVWDLQTGEQRHQLDGGSQPMRWRFVAFSPDGNILAGSGHRGVALWEARTGQYITTLTVPGRAASSIAFNPSGNALAAVFGITLTGVFIRDGQPKRSVCVWSM